MEEIMRNLAKEVIVNALRDLINMKTTQDVYDRNPHIDDNYNILWSKIQPIHIKTNNDFVTKRGKHSLKCNVCDQNIKPKAVLAKTYVKDQIIHIKYMEKGKIKVIKTGLGNTPQNIVKAKKRKDKIIEKNIVEYNRIWRNEYRCKCENPNSSLLDWFESESREKGTYLYWLGYSGFNPVPIRNYIKKLRLILDGAVLQDEKEIEIDRSTEPEPHYITKGYLPYVRTTQHGKKWMNV